jgi:hypothetical protein
MRRLISKDEVSIIPSANLRVPSDVSRSRNRTFLKMPTFGYATQAELFDYGTEAELFTANLRKSRREPLGYKRSRLRMRYDLQLRISHRNFYS